MNKSYKVILALHILLVILYLPLCIMHFISNNIFAGSMSVICVICWSGCVYYDIRAIQSNRKWRKNPYGESK